MKTKLKVLTLTLLFGGKCFSKGIEIDTSYQKRIAPIDTTSETMGTVSIKAKVSKESVSSVYNIMRKSLVVADGVSSESIKKTPDATVGDVLKRVSGVTVQNNKFVVVRGLPDRYNITLLNGGFVLPTEPDRKSFSFDVIPSNLIDNLLVYKSASANLPGDFSGGLVDVSTVGVKDRNFQNVNLGLGFGSLSSFRNFYTFDHSNLSSKFPTTYEYRSGSSSERKEWTSLLGGPSSYTNSKRTALPNYNLNYNLGIKKKNLGIIGSISYRTNYSTSFSERKDYENGKDVSYIYKDTQYSRTNLLSGILNLDYSKKKYSIQFKNLFSSQIENTFLKRGGPNFDNGMDISTSGYNTTSKNLINSQASYKRGKVTTEATFGGVYRTQPDYRVDPHSKSIGSESPYTVIWRETYRFWSEMRDMSYGIKSDYASKNFRGGISYWGKSRNFSARVFRYSSESLLDEITNNTDRYSASFGLFSSYGLWEKSFDKIKISSGLRNESNLFRVRTADFSGSPVEVEKFYSNFLPSFNLIIKTNNKSNLRVSGSKTVARPEFREVSNFSYYDFTRNSQIVGNPKLVQSSIYNGDIKFECFPKSDEILSLGIFGKRISSPIEQTVAEGSTPSNFILTFSNSQEATILGLEGEVRKKIKGIGTIYSNFSLVDSRVKTPIGIRPLQGQSPFTLNLGANFDVKGISFNITENLIGSRISSVGFTGYPDIYENMRGVLDLSVQAKKERFTWKFNAGNILPQNIVLFQKPDREMIKTTTESNFSFSITYNLK